MILGHDPLIGNILLKHPFSNQIFVVRILQGLGVDPGSATERWPYRKNARKSAFFVKKIKLPKKYFFNTPGTAGGPGGRDRTLAIKSKKIARKLVFFLEKK